MLFFQTKYTNDAGVFFFIQDCFSVILEDNLHLQSDISYKTYIYAKLRKKNKKCLIMCQQLTKVLHLVNYKTSYIYHQNLPEILE